MRAFLEAWRTEIIRGATLFCVVLAIGLSVRYLVARARERVVNRLPEALREIRGEFDSDAEGGPPHDGRDLDLSRQGRSQARAVDPQHARLRDSRGRKGRLRSDLGGEELSVVGYGERAARGGPFGCRADRVRGMAR